MRIDKIGKVYLAREYLPNQDKLVYAKGDTAQKAIVGLHKEKLKK